MGHAALSARMNGHRDFTLSELEKTADFLRVSLRDLLDFDADREERR